MKKLSLAGILVGLLSGPASAQSCYSGLVAFGDSLTDTGNLYETFGFPLPPYAPGRISDGDVWIDGFATSLGLSSLNSASGGNNYAWANARTGPAGTVLPPLTLLDQAATYLSNMSGVADPDALFVLWGGANDARDNDTQNAAPNIAAIINDLASAGANHFLVLNLPDLGQTPESLSGNAPGGTAAQITAASISYNAALTAELATISATQTDVTIIEFDVFTLFNQVLSNPAAFGFSNVTVPCWSGGYFGFGTQCANPEEYLFWDDIHPTTAAHAVVGSEAFNAVSSAAPLDTDGDCDPDMTDPDDDNDGIGDSLDDNPLVASNFCSSGAAAYLFSEIVVNELTCAAEASISVVPQAGVLDVGDLHLIAPVVSFESGFSVAGLMTVTSADPCPGCSP